MPAIVVLILTKRLSVCKRLVNTHQTHTFFSKRHYTLLISQKKTRVLIWLYDDTKLHLEEQNLGYDDHMNTRLEGAVEIIGGKRTEKIRICLGN